jgi:hypothetical protein
MVHYICTGSCKSESRQPGICEAEFCSNEGKSLLKCECEDGSHTNAGEETDGKNNE